MLQLWQYEDIFIFYCTCSTCTICSTQSRRSQPLRIKNLSSGACPDSSCCISRFSADKLQTLHFEDNFIISYTCSSTVLARGAVLYTLPRRSQPLRIRDLSAARAPTAAAAYLALQRISYSSCTSRIISLSLTLAVELYSHESQYGTHCHVAASRRG